MNRLATIDELPDVPMTKHRRYAAYAPSGSQWLGNLPSHWKIRRLKFVARSQPSNVDKKTADGEIPVRLCNYVDVYKNDYITPDLDFMHATADPTELAKFRLRQGDVLITKDSEEWNDIAVPAYVTQDFEDLACGYHLSQVRPHASVMNGEYLFRAFRASGVAEQFHVRANGITRFGLAAGAIGDVVFPVPPVDEQRVIASFLRRETASIDALIAKKQRLIELLGEKRAAVIDHSVTRGLEPDVATKPTRFEWLTEAPSHWKVRAFRYSARIPNGQVDPEASEFRDLPLIAPNHIESGTGRLLSFETAAEQAAESGKYAFTEGSILYSKIRPGLAKVCIAPERGLCSADMYPITPRGDIRPKFLMYYMLSRTFTAAVVLMSDRVAMPKINRRDLGAFPILVPPLSEQDEIIDTIERTAAAIDRLADCEQSAIDTLREYRSALISAAVTGKIDVRDVKERTPCQ